MANRNRTNPIRSRYGIRTQSILRIRELIRELSLSNLSLTTRRRRRPHPRRAREVRLRLRTETLRCKLNPRGLNARLLANRLKSRCSGCFSELLAPTPLLPTPGRIEAVAKALKRWTPDQLVTCIEGYAGAPFWQARRAQMPTFEALFADANGEVEKGIRSRQKSDWRDPRTRSNAPAPPVAAADPPRSQRSIDEIRAEVDRAISPETRALLRGPDR
jgi:hypothetical protein